MATPSLPGEGAGLPHDQKWGGKGDPGRGPGGPRDDRLSGLLEVTRPGEHGMAQVNGVSRPGATPGQPCIFKLVLLGSGSVGKSSLALRYVKNDFKSILPTVGCAFFTKVVDLGATSLKFEIWDTAGQEKYHSVCRLYFRGANAALLVYDVTRKWRTLQRELATSSRKPLLTTPLPAAQLGLCPSVVLFLEHQHPSLMIPWDSFCKAQQWLKDLEEEFHSGEVVVMLVGNKTDLEEEREVTLEEGKEFAESKGLLFMETSAKLNYQVTEVFSAVARELSRREESKEGQRRRRDAPLTLSERPSLRGRCCAH
ncbi:ras-related protein Rab-17 isoform 1-T1 [Dama dama]